ncbi:hypothetical protein B0H12DRAFT_1117441 [Mycena haematopus]|nr:hypothetical protein B0H12DRAFT_1117441 [Mycena haematopus]
MRRPGPSTSIYLSTSFQLQRRSEAYSTPTLSLWSLFRHFIRQPRRVHPQSFSMVITRLPHAWSVWVQSWAHEYAHSAFDHCQFMANSLKHTSTRPVRIQNMPGPSLTGCHVLASTFPEVATACSLAIIGTLISMAVFLFLWNTQHRPPKPQVAALSESTVLQIYDMASRQPYQMPPDGDGDPGTFPVLPFARNPRKQSVFVFWLLFLVIAGAVAYVAVSSFIVEKHATLSWTFALVLSMVLANISGRFLQFAFFLTPIIRSTIQWAHWILVIVAVEPAATANSAYLQVTRITQALSHWYFGIPHNLALPERIERSTTLISSAVSAAAGYHLISSRVARNYTLVLKSIVKESLGLLDFYVSLRHAPFFPTHHFQIWSWWTMKHTLRFILGELSWASISYLKLFVLLTPTFIICAYRIYQYNQVIIPPIQLEFKRLNGRLDRQEVSFRRRDVEVAEIKRILQNIDQRFANFGAGGFGGGRGTREAPF